MLLSAQDFRPPLNIPLKLTGNFGELRNNHFHAGLDIATDQAIGQPVYACADGYVSRIVVGGSGYGKALYITHPNGLTTVYGHLEGFGEGIAQWVKRTQYQQEQFELDIKPAKNELPVVRGQVVAISGNTGASAGPHLHFEIRKGDTALNPMLFGFDISDTRPPEVSHLYVYSYWEGMPGFKPKVYPLQKIAGRWQPTGAQVSAPGTSLGLGVYAWDRQNARENRNGVYRAELLLDGEPHFSFKLDSISFHDRRYLNAHTDYRVNLENGRKIHRLFRLPGNALSIYPIEQNRGLIPLLREGTSQVDINLYDFAGNKSSIAFRVKRDSLGLPPAAAALHLQMWDEPLSIQQDGLHFEMDGACLYEDMPFEAGLKNGSAQRPRWSVADVFTPIHREAKIRLSADWVPERHRQKALIVHEDQNGYKRPLGGVWESGFVSTKTDRLGDFYVAIDSVAPTVSSLNIKNGQALGGLRQLRFRVRDNLSSIKHFRAEIDGRWVLFEYEAKESLLYHHIEDWLEPGRHELVLQVRDERGNQTELRISFTR